jgi:hypothetical protein
MVNVDGGGRSSTFSTTSEVVCAAIKLRAARCAKKLVVSYGLSRVSVQVAQYCELLPQPAGESVPG